MARGFNVSVSMGEVKRLFETLPKELVEEVSGIMENTAKEFVARAKRDAPVDTGFLRNQISYVKNSELSFQVVSGSFQAGFIEFGTKRRFQPIPGFEAEAASIKGIKGGSREQFLENIRQWVKRKGIKFSRTAGKALSPEETAFIIYLSILRNGIKAQPYFFQQVQPAQKQMQADLNAIVLD